MFGVAIYNCCELVTGQNQVETPRDLSPRIHRPWTHALCSSRPWVSTSTSQSYLSLSMSPSTSICALKQHHYHVFSDTHAAGADCKQASRQAESRVVALHLS